MPSFEIAVRRLLRRLRDGLPGSSEALRLSRQSGQWRHLPPHQRAGAYAQFLQVQRQLLQQHYQSKLAPKLVDWVFKLFIAHWKTPWGALFLLLLVVWLLGGI